MPILLVPLFVACTPGSEADPSPTGTKTPSSTSPTSPTSPTSSTTDPTTPLERRLVAVLHGGGPEEDALFGRFVAEAGGGRFVTLGSNDPADPYLRFWDDYFVSLGAQDAVTVNTTSRDDAFDPAAEQAIDQADAVFMRGGDQAAYLAEWTDTPIHEALRRAVARGAVIGGSSAGCAVLGERVFDARAASPDAWEALNDPYDGLTFTDGWLDLLPGVVTDTHLTERGRMPRLAVFVARWWAEGQAEPIGVGVDPETALFVYDDGTADVVGTGSVTLVRAPASAEIAPGTPVDLRELPLWQLPAGYTVDLTSAEPVLERPDWVAPVDAPIAAGPWPELVLDGDDVDQRVLGDWVIPEIDDADYPWYRGRLTEAPGDGDVPGSFVLTRLYDDSDRFEAHLGGLMWTLARHPGTVGVGVDLGHRARLTAPVGVETLRGWTLVVDTRGAAYAGDPEQVPQTVAVERAVVHVVGEGAAWP